MANRNAYRNWTAEQLESDAIATWERMVINGVPVRYLVDSRNGERLPLFRLSFEEAKERYGLKLVTVDIHYQLDAEGKPILNEKGQPIEESRTTPAHDLAIPVKVEGYTDAFGTPIPKGKQYFIGTKQPNNRPMNLTNVADLAGRLDHWPLTGEPLLKDEHGGGQSEQHRCGAVIWDTLTGSNRAPSQGIPTITIDGVSIGASGAIDTGKPKTTADDFGSRPDLLPSPRSLMDFRTGKHEGFGEKEKQERVKILREAQGVVKRVLLRMLGSNIKASKFSGYESSGNASIIAENWTGFDELVNMAFAYITGIPMNQPGTRIRQRPCSTWEVATAYCLWLLRKSEPLQSVESLTEYTWPTIDLEPLQEFLIDLEDGAQKQEGRLGDWCRDRVTSLRLKDSDEVSFAQVLIAMDRYFKGEEVTKSINGADVTGKDRQNGAKFTFLGGADKGPSPKKSKKSE